MVIKIILGYILGIISATLFEWLWTLVKLDMPWGGRLALADVILGLSCFGGALTVTKDM